MRRGLIAQYGLLAGPMLSMLDSSIVNVAILPVARGLHTSIALAQWAVSGYLLALGTGLAATAYLARRLGTAQVYRASLVAFTLTSAACAVAPGVGWLIAARAAQGLVAAPLVPLAMSMLLGRDGERRSVSPVAGVLLFAGPALGPAVGGVLIGAGGWRLIFVINVPIGVLAATAAWRLPATDEGQVSGGFDLSGLVTLAGGLALLLFAATDGAGNGWSQAWPYLAGGGLLLAGYAWHARRTEFPALDVSLAADRIPALSMGLCAMASVITWAAVFLLPLFVQEAQGRGALAAGIAMAPQGIVTGLSTALSGRVLTRLTVRGTVMAGFAVLAVASLAFLAIGAGTALWVIAAILAVRSVSIGLVINPLLQALTAPLTRQRMADASTLFNVTNRVAGSFGIGLIAAMYVNLARSSGPVSALHATGLVITGIAGAGVLLALALPGVKNVPGLGG